MTTGAPAPVVEVESFGDYAYEQGWTDGLPVVEPTPERVAEHVAASGLDPLEVVAVMAPGQGVATVEAIAVNAVMAGVLPEHLPVVLAAVRAVTTPEFNLEGVQATTNPVAPLVVVNGPIARRLDFNSGSACFGPGNRSNAVVGRALRFCLLNIGHATPGERDMATQGQPAKYTFCCAENEEESPWEPHHVERGFGPGDDCVTVFQAGMFVNILDLSSMTASSLLVSLAGGLATTASNNIQVGHGDALVVVCPEHAQMLAREGMSKDDVKRYLHEHSQIPAGRFAPDILSSIREWRSERYADPSPETPIAVVDDWRELRIVVAGGVGSHSAFIPGFGDGSSVTVRI